MQTHFTLTSPAGRFSFPKGTILSHAKLIRDTVTAGYRGTIPHTSRPTETNVVVWVREQIMGPAAKNNFKWVIA